MRKAPGMPDSLPSSWSSQSSVVAKRLCTTRTMQMPPARASTVHSLASGGEPGYQPGPSLTNFYRAASGGAGWGEMLAGFVAPAVLGNVVGGVLLVALLNYGQVAAEGEESGAEKQKR